MDGSADTTTPTAANVASVVNADDVPFTTATSVDDPDYGGQIRGLQQNMQRLQDNTRQEFEARAHESSQEFETLREQIKAVSDMLGHISRLSLATKRNIAGARELGIGHAPIRVVVDGFNDDSGSGSGANTSYGTAPSEDENNSASTVAAQHGKALRARLRLRM